MIRVLHISDSMNRNGQETFIMNLYRNVDRNKVQFDFILFTNLKSDYDDEIASLGGIIYRVPVKSKNPLSNFLKIKSIVKRGNYKIVHRHFANASMAWELLAAKAGGAIKTVAHSHSTANPHIFLHKISRPVLNIIATDKFACSKNAGIWMFKNANFRIIPNAIDANRYIFNHEIRNEMRKEFGINKEFIIGNIGRMCKPKNQKFLIQLFSKIRKLNNNVKLMIVGDGELRGELESEATKYGIRQDVIFTGSRADVADLFQAFDLFIFPSIYEGLGIAVIEAQASGLACIVSDAIPKEAYITDNLISISLNRPQEHWAELIANRITNYSRENKLQEIKKSGYDISSLTYFFEKFYQE